MVAKVVASFYAKARQDDLIGPVFNRVVALFTGCEQNGNTLHYLFTPTA